MTFLVIPPVVALFTILGDIYPNGLSAPPLTVAQADSICGRVISREAGNSITIFDLDAKRQVKLYAHGPLARGGFFPDANWTEANGYLISDVKVGDIVDLNIVKVGEFYRAFTVQIFERPGGLMPPSRFKLRKEGERYHDIATRASRTRSSASRCPSLEPVPELGRPAPDSDFKLRKPG